MNNDNRKLVRPTSRWWGRFRLLIGLFFVFILLVVSLAFDGSVLASPGAARQVTRTATPLPTAIPNSSTGFHGPAGQAAVSGGDGNGYEKNPANLLDSDSLMAIDNNSGSSSSLTCGDTGKDRHQFDSFDFAIPVNATIAGLQVRLEAKADSTAGAPRICVQLSGDGGVSWTAAKVTANLETTEAFYMPGGPADGWGRTWSRSELSNAKFRLRLSNVSSDVNRDFSLDWVGVNVYYTMSSPPPPTATPTQPVPSATPTPVPGGTQAIPLIDMSAANYFGFSGGLYFNGNNLLPWVHAVVGLARANLIQPLNAAGNPSASGKIVLLSIGMSNTAREFGETGTDQPWTFIGKVGNDPDVNQTSLILINGAKSGQDAPDWESPDNPNYDRVRDSELAPNGLTENQVQAIWLKVANADASSHPSLPAPDADAYVLMARMGNILRALHSRYPNLQQVFISSRIYAGYAEDDSLNPEPYAYESGFAVKWLIEAQIRQMTSGQIDEWAGNLNYNTAVPWIVWGPYLWADGPNPRSDGLVWLPEDFADDGTHPSLDGQGKVANMLLSFFKNSPLTQGWFLEDAN